MPQSYLLLHINHLVMRLLLTFYVILFSYVTITAQSDEDARMIKSIHDNILTEGDCYDWLYHLSEKIGGRLAGSVSSIEAVNYTAEVLSQFSDTVYKQDCKVPYWTRGAAEVVTITNLDTDEDKSLDALALGNSVGTGNSGVEAPVIEVQTLDEVRALGREGIAGKIVFYNRPMDPTQIKTFFAYGGAADQRVNGPAVAAEYGAVGALVRSLTTLTDDVPHTGVTRYKEGVPKIPAVAISTMDADRLSAHLKHKEIIVRVETHSQMVDTQKPSYNVVAEIKGSTYPDEIILVGGHIDSWDVGGGAHDDGAGCVHAMEVLNTVQKLNYQPKRTIRCVLFMNEENGLGGGLAYAAASNQNGEYHMAAIESDAGGFSPRGFSCDATDEAFAPLYRQVIEWESLLEPYGLHLSKGGSGADINPLKDQKGLLFGLRPDSQRYFDYHHTRNDRIEAVNERELKLGAAAMTSLVYLLDNHGLTKATDE
jgi:hypothetical protein